MRLAVLLSCLAALPGWSQTRSALAWEQRDGYRSAAVDPKSGGKSGFTLLDSGITGVAFSNVLSDATVAQNQIYLVGSGVALGDVDGDGWCDIYLCRLEGPNVLYRNLGAWKFEDITASADAACPDQFSTGAVLADLDADGDLDLLVNAIGGGTRCFLNDGKAHFTENLESGLVRKLGATSLALADVDNDGDLDVYVANYRATTIRSTGLQVLVVNGRRVLRPQDREFYELTREGMILEHGEPDYLYLNDGMAHFSVLPWADGHFRDEDGKPITAAPKDWSLSAMFRDMNGDGAPDLYVCNDFQSPDRIWLNDGRGNFNALPRLAMRNMSTFSMGVDFADLDRDGHDDFLVLDMLSRDHARRMRQRAMRGQNSSQPDKVDDRPQLERNTLFRNRGDGTYAELARYAGLHASEWSWGIVFMDVDLDGYEDTLITTGHGFDTQDSDTEKKLTARGKAPNEKVGDNILHYPRLHIPNVAFRNRGDWTFEEIGAAWGFNQTGVSHGIATADLDNDGDLDVVVNNLNAPAGIFRNNTSAPRIGIRVKEVGAKIRLSDGQSQEVISGGRYLSGDDGLRVFAAPKPLDIEVTWRDGKHSTVKNAQPNRTYEIDKSISSAPLAKGSVKITPIFEECSNGPAGPGVAWYDEDPAAITNVVADPLATRHHDVLQKFPDATGVVFSDLNGDGFPELILARKWAPLTVFENRNGNLVDATERLGLSEYTGFWNGVTTGDFDGDGRLDIAASNWGRNTPYQQFLKDEWRGWFSDSGEVLEAYVDPKTRKVVPALDLDSLGARFPVILERFSSSAAYGEASLDEILGSEKSKMRERRVRWLDSTVFLNRGDRFEARPLPFEAQLAPAFGICAADIDNDGNEDLFLAQNFFDPRDPAVRYDAGRSLWLKGDGHGSFKPLTAQESGIAIYGGAQGAAACDFDRDGRIDLAVAPNKLYHNTTSRRGLRVRLKDGIGAVIRIVYQNGFGPAREIHGRSGYLSQDSPVQVLGYSSQPKALQVRRPGGKEMTYPIGDKETIEIP